MTVAKKIGAKQWKKMAPYTNDCAQKNSEPNSVGSKKMCLIKMSVAKKNRSKTVDNKNWHLIKMVAAKKI